MVRFMRALSRFMVACVSVMAGLSTFSMTVQDVMNANPSDQR